ncbi:complex I subunit 4 family protein [Paenibacillus chungangensis]|uniref:NuoM family protein n=1 Tax=Paenibacillus chungangensis TaxID=696535 RepID=A0ABW3HKA3_9BACL
MSILADIPILSLIIWSPLLGFILILLLPRSRSGLLKGTAIAVSLVPLVLSMWLYADMGGDRNSSAYEEKVAWGDIPLNSEALNDPGIGVVFSMQYSLGVDGLSLPLVLLTALVTAMASFAAIHVKKRWKAFYCWFFLLELGMLGAFLARDLFLFFIFFEITLVAMYFLIGIWGYYNRERAANMFLLYNGIGSALMLIAFVMLTMTAGFRAEPGASGMQLIYSANYADIMHNLANPSAWVNVMPSEEAVNPFYMDSGMQWTTFILLFIAFGIKLPVFPFHTWMLKVHVEAPPAVVMIHSGILLKLGAYGLIRFGLTLFPEQYKDWSPLLAVLGVISLLYGAIIAFRQTEFKLMLAYSSVSHMGIVLIGLAALNELGYQGAVFQLVSHGVISALLFLIVGSLYERTRTTELQELGGLSRSMPFMSGVLLFAGLASLGLPGLSGFIGELLSLLGLFDTMEWVVAAAMLGIVLTAVYVLRGVLAITFGAIDEKHVTLRDARFIEALPMAVLVAVIVLLGCYPSLLTSMVEPGAAVLMEQLISARTGG